MNIDDHDNFYAITFEQQDFSSAEIKGKEFDNCTFKKCDFNEAILNKCNFIECDFLDCNLSLIKIQYSKFNDVTFRDSKLIGIDWTKVAWSNLATEAPVSFYKSILNDCSFYGLSLQELIIEECKAHHVDFREGDFSMANFTHTDLTGSMYGNTRLTNADFSEATNYDINVFQSDIKGAKFSRFDAVRLLDSLDIELVD
ncbi:MAG: pentapeptide repeat-containing protein [Immundisolibacteraceae bacterium]|nr:pentapeptide repeat-containing protein [Immundisolibacteraceae bacterium]